jgi:ribosomal protein L11 methyltransferase
MRHSPPLPRNFWQACPLERKFWARRANVVIANILAGPLVQLSTTLLEFIQPKGTLLLSGLLQHQAEAVCTHYAQQLTLQVAAEREGWVCLRGDLL